MRKALRIWALVLAAVVMLSAVPAAAGERQTALLPEGQAVPQVPGGDGFFSGTDLLLLKAYALQKQGLSGGLDMTEFLLSRRQLLALSALSLGQLGGISGSQTQILTPGETLSLEKNAVVLGADTGTMLVWQGGSLITAAVREAPLTLSAPEGELFMDPGSRAGMEATLNHPVNRKLRYESSDAAVASVDENGVVTAGKPGVATVTATLPDGQSVSRTVRVIPMAGSVMLSHDTLKVKHGGGTKVLTAAIAPADAQEPLIWESSDPSVATVDENGVVTGLSDGYATITCTAKYSGTAASCQVKVCDLMQVALTFDDGPSAKYTMLLLDALEQYGVKATFFFVGNRIYTAKDAVQRMVETGHELGYHTWTHQFFYNMDADQISKDYKKFQSVLKSACGQEATVYRAPGGTVTGAALSIIPLPHIHWNVGTRDWATRDTEKVKNAILDGLKDGAIILLHDIHGTTYTGTVAALEEIFAQDMDVEFLTVTELLSRDGTPPRAGKTYYGG